jgi:hypothetical protein
MESRDQHGVAIAVKAIPLLDGLAICGEDAFTTGERGNQHQQGRARQVEIRDEALDDAKAVAR